jgi:hypothetical protein
VLGRDLGVVLLAVVAAMKLDTGSMWVLAVVLSAPALYWFPGTLVFWIVFRVVLDVFKESAERHDREER